MAAKNNSETPSVSEAPKGSLTPGKTPKPSIANTPRHALLKMGMKADMVRK